MRRAISLDFGTSNTSMAVSKEFQATILPNNRNSRYTPSLVAFNEGRTLIGEEAMKPSITVENVVYSMKKMLGLGEKDVKKFSENYRYKLQSEEGKISVQTEDRSVKLEEVVAMLFLYLKDHAESLIGPLGGVVLTTPSSYGRTQRRALEDAAYLANIPVMHLIDETTAAAINFALETQEKKNRMILIFQLGGGSIDVAVFNIDGTSVERLSSVATNQLGGEDFDTNMLNYALEGSKVERNADTLAMLQKACEKAKTELGLSNNVKISTDYPKIDVKLSKQQFESINSPILNLISAMIESAIHAADKNVSQIDNYFLIGRCTRMPIVVDILEKKLSRNKRRQVVEADEAAVKGAAQFAEYLSGRMALKLAVRSDVGTRYQICTKEGQLTVDGPFKTREDGNLVVPKRKWHQSLQVIMESLQKGRGEMDIEVVVDIGHKHRLSMTDLQISMKKISDYRKEDKETLRIEEDISRLGEEVARVKDHIFSLMSPFNESNMPMELQKLLGNCQEIELWIESENYEKTSIDQKASLLKNVQNDIVRLEQRLQHTRPSTAKRNEGGFLGWFRVGKDDRTGTNFDSAIALLIDETTKLEHKIYGMKSEMSHLHGTIDFFHRQESRIAAVIQWINCKTYTLEDLPKYQQLLDDIQREVETFELTERPLPPQTVGNLKKQAEEAFKRARKLLLNKNLGQTEKRKLTKYTQECDKIKQYTMHQNCTTINVKEWQDKLDQMDQRLCEWESQFNTPNRQVARGGSQKPEYAGSTHR